MVVKTKQNDAKTMWKETTPPLPKKVWARSIPGKKYGQQFSNVFDFLKSEFFFFLNTQKKYKPNELKGDHVP